MVGYSITYNNKWIAVGQGINSIAISSDGINWSSNASANSIFSSGFIGAVAFNNSFCVAGGDSSAGNKLAYSPDGIIWSLSANGNSIFNAGIRALASNGSLWVAGAEGG